MSHPSFERKPVASIVVPVVAIVAALVIGAITKRNENRSNVSFQSQMRTARNPGVVLAGTMSGLGIAKTPFGDVPETPAFPFAAGSAAWVRFDFSDSPSDLLQSRRSMMFTLVDGEGKHWPFDEVWLSNSIYLVVPLGYAAVPRKLYAKFSLSGREVSSVEMPSLPAVRVKAFDGVSKGWKGLVTESVRLLSDQRTAKRVFVDCPLPPGNVLTAKVLGTPYLEPEVKSEWLIRGPDPGRYFQAIDLPLRYPESSPKVYLEISELKPVHTSKRISFTQIPMVERFGFPWVTKESPEVAFSPGVSFWVGGWSSVPYRMGSHPIRSIHLRLASRGLVRHVNAKLISPTQANGVPLRMESQTFTLGEIESSRTPSTWTGGPLNIEMDIEADVYKVVHKALVAVDLTKARTITDPIGRMINPFPLTDSRPGLMPLMAQFASPLPIPQVAR